MSGYFYPKPLAAAWMTQEHGMRFSNEFERGPQNVATRLYEGAMWSYQDNDNLRLYVHDDSLFMLEPIIGDVVEVREGEFYKTVRLHDVYDKERLKAEWKLHRIIQRDGKAFFWPNREGA